MCWPIEEGLGTNGQNYSKEQISTFFSQPLISQAPYRRCLLLYGVSGYVKIELREEEVL